MNIEKITKLENIVPLDKNESIIDYKIKRLTAAGENYGSLMLSVDITVKTPKGTREINAVAKMVPPNEFIQKVFNTQVSFKNEIGFYKEVIPTLQNFQREQGINEVIDFFPEYYGSRINLNEDSDVVDSDAVLLLNNLKISGYINIDRTVGFDLETTKLILNDLAHFHAVPLALKIKKPAVFEAKIRKHLHHHFHESDGSFSGKMATLIEAIENCPVNKSRVLDVVRKDTFKEPTVPREPFATICHNDYWTNNTMVKFEEGKPIKNKMVDLQMCDYKSPAADLLFFLFSSVQNSVIEKYYEDLVRYYHQIFTSVLEELKCDTTPFSFDALIKEFDLEAIKEFKHCVMMTFPIFAPKGSVKELWEFTPEDLVQSDMVLTEAHKEKLNFTFNEFAKRNWI